MPSGDGVRADRLYLEDPYLSRFDAEVVASDAGWCALTRTAFYPGGGGQPHDRGHLIVRGAALPVSAVREDGDGCVWHEVGREVEPGAAASGEIDWPFRYAMMRGHGLMHVVNSVALRRFGGLITGVQIGAERSRIDFRLAAFTRAEMPELERAVNEVIDGGLAVTSSVIGVEEYRRRPELVRTLNVLPPVSGDAVRIVAIDGFDAQACGGTHVHSTREIGRAHLERFDNKGRDNKRFYWTLSAAGC